MPAQQRGIKPRTSGLTAEAAEALNLNLDEDGVSADDELRFIEDASFGLPLTGEASDNGDAIYTEPQSRLKTEAEPPPEPHDAKAGIPTITEWEDFFSRIVLRVLCDWYIQIAFRGIDEDLLTDRDIDRLSMTPEERKRIAVPPAELSNKSKWMRKHGRKIVASGGMMDAMIALGAWTSRVNRIARRYKPKTVRGNLNDSPRQDASTADAEWTQGTSGGRINGNGYIYNPGTS